MHRRETVFPERVRVAVVIPALNEEESIGKVVRAIPRHAAMDILVVDNGSTDGTADVARQAGATVLVEPRRGYGAACLRGIAHARSLGASVVAFLDGDFSDFPEELPALIRPICEEKRDLVIGSRMAGVREPGSLLPQAILGNWLATSLIMLFWGYRFTDLGPFRAVTMQALDRLDMRSLTYGWTVEMQVKAAQFRFRCAEVPVRYRKRIGQSKVTGTVAGTLKASVIILSTIIGAVFVRGRRS